MIEVPAPETLLLDTSYLGIVKASSRRSYLTAEWPPGVVARIAAAVPAISVMTVAEERAGEIKDGWGAERVETADHQRRGLVWIPPRPGHRRAVGDAAG